MKRPRNPIDGRRETVIRVRLVPMRCTIAVDWGTEPDYSFVSYFSAGEYLGGHRLPPAKFSPAVERMIAEDARALRQAAYFAEGLRSLGMEPTWRARGINGLRFTEGKS